MSEPTPTSGYALVLEAVAYPLLAATLVSAAALLVFGAVRRAWALPSARRPGGVALALGYLAGHLLIESWRPFPPRERLDWLWYLALAAIPVALVESWRPCPGWLRWAVRLPLWLAVVWALLPVEVRDEGRRQEIIVWLAGLGQAGLLLWALLDLQGRRLPAPVLPLVLLIVASGAAAVLFRGPSLKQAQLATLVVAALAPIAVRSAFRPALVLTTAPVMVLLPGLGLVARFYNDPAPPAASLALLLSALQVGALACWRPATRWRGWLRGAIVLLLVAGLTVGAVTLADPPPERMEEPKDETVPLW
jgi:hypothetical protein